MKLMGRNIPICGVLEQNSLKRIRGEKYSRLLTRAALSFHLINGHPADFVANGKIGPGQVAGVAAADGLIDENVLRMAYVLTANMPTKI